MILGPYYLEVGWKITPLIVGIKKRNGETHTSIFQRVLFEA